MILSFDFDGAPPPPPTPPTPNFQSRFWLDGSNEMGFLSPDSLCGMEGKWGGEGWSEGGWEGRGGR
jgi:hypothetical protein